LEGKNIVSHTVEGTKGKRAKCCHKPLLKALILFKRETLSRPYHLIKAASILAFTLQQINWEETYLTHAKGTLHA
jgi:hypothetical protein